MSYSGIVEQFEEDSPDPRSRKKGTRLQTVRGVLPTKDIDQIYFKGRRIGTGAIGSVFIVQKQNYDKMSFVLKQIRLEEGFEAFVQREYDILRMMDHPFITTIVEAYYSEKFQILSLVNPLYEGGEVMN